MILDISWIIIYQKIFRSFIWLHDRRVGRGGGGKYGGFFNKGV